MTLPAPGTIPRVPLGEYDLVDVIGRGGMGHVWRARHRPTGSFVAVKVLTAFAARHKRFLSAFRNEIRACAGLSHPSIVRVLDRGEIPSSVEALTEGQVPAESPFLVMEYVGGGSLDPWAGRLTWPEIKMVLLGVLDALAHAHARGLVHRDIKPANILLNESRTEIRLTDFGLVHDIEELKEGRRERGMAGTPRYMAPEQCQGRWRDYGPGTDFYALGGVGWTLATGAPPFGAIRSQFDLLIAHQEREPPPLAPLVDVPDGFEGWLRTMLAKAPEDRPFRASEAAAALRRLGVSAALTLSSTMLEQHLEDSVSTDPAMRALPGLAEPSPRFRTLLESSWGEDTHTEFEFETVTMGTLANIPTRWTDEEWLDGRGWLEDRSGDLGLGLFWLRQPALVSRSAERDAVWDALRAVGEKQSAQAVVLRGEPGIGKSRLAQWLCERSHEIGGAEFLKATHAPGGRSSDSLSSMLARRFRTGGLSFEELRERLVDTLAARGTPDPDRCTALAELIHPNDATNALAETRPFYFGSKWEQLRVVQNTLEELARQRLHVVWLDDAQWGMDSLLLVKQVLEEQRRRPARLLFVLTVDTQALEGRTLEKGVLEDIMALPACQAWDLPPLDRREVRQLALRLLRLERSLVDWIAERTGGNPMFTIQTVGEWVDRSILESSADGFRLRPGAQIDLAADLAAMWNRRLTAFLSRRASSDAASLELAAVLSQDLTDEDWLAVCQTAGLLPNADLLDQLLDEGLARAGGAAPTTGWAFAHPMIREALLDRAQAAGHLNRHHMAAARHLGIRGGHGSSERVALHLLPAGQQLQALGSLAAGTWELVQLDELGRAAALLERFEATLDHLQIAPDDPRRGQALLLRARLAVRSGDIAGFEHWAEAARQRAGAMGWEHIVVYMAHEFAALHRRRGQLREALHELSEVGRWAEANGDRALLARSLLEKGLVARDVGEPDDAELLFQSAYLLFEQLEESVLAGRAAVEQAEIAAREGKRLEARVLLQTALDHFAQGGARVGPAESARLMGLDATLEGRASAALASYEASIKRYEALGSQDQARAEAGLGVALVLDGQPERADPHLRTALERFGRSGEQLEANRARVGLLAADAARGRWEDVRTELAILKQTLRQPLWEIELRRCCAGAAEHARAAGEVRLAKTLDRLAQTE